MKEKERVLKRKKGPLMRDVAISAERLSLMIEFHNRGSIASLERSANNLNRGSASKVDLLKYNQDVNNRRFSNPSLQLKHSTPNMRRHGSLGKDKVTFFPNPVLFIAILKGTGNNVLHKVYEHVHKIFSFSVLYFINF